MKKQISVIGCGWLGFPLAQFLIDKGFEVKGSTTSKGKLEVLKKHNIKAYLIELSPSGINGDYLDFFANNDTIIINIPPGLRKNPSKNHVEELKHLVCAIEKQGIKNVLYISSTSVFKDEPHFPKITEYTLPNATSNSAKQLIEIEQMLQTNSNFNTTILRFGGLFDKNRHPGNYLSGKKNISNPNAPINLIHKNDCVEIITSIVKQNLWNVSLNAAHPIHPDKKSYYSNYCRLNKLPIPEFNTIEKSKGKLIDSSKLVQLLTYTFKHAP